MSTVDFYWGTSLDTKVTVLSAQENDENKRKNDKLFEWLKDLEFDIICLQATHFVNECEFIYNSR